MKSATRAGVALLVCLPLTGCYVKTYGLQSTGNGQTTTATSTQVSGSAKFSGGRASFSSGQVPPPGAPGGHVYLGKGASAVVIAGFVIGDFLNFVAGFSGPKPLPPDTKIMDTCSCYQQEPVTSDE